MNSSVAFCCTCFRTASYAFAISVFWPTGGGPLACLFAFSCSARHRRPRKIPQAPRAATIFGSAPSVQDRWWSSRDSRLPTYNFVLHRWSPPPHETTLHIQKTVRASPRSVVVRLIAEQTSSSGFLAGSLRDIFSHQPPSGRAVGSDVLGRTVPAHLHTNSYLHSISIGPAFAARAASSKSLYRKRARAPSSRYPLRRTRASDKALRLFRSLARLDPWSPGSRIKLRVSRFVRERKSRL